MSLEDLIGGVDTVDGGDGRDGAGIDPNSKSKPQLEEEMISKIRADAERSARASLSAQLLSDPDVSALLAAKREGKKVKLIPLNERGEGLGEGLDGILPRQTANGEDIEPVDLESLDNAGLLKHATKQIGSQLSSYLDKQFQRLEQKFSGTQKYVVDETQRRIDQQIEDTKKKYAKFNDFEKYEEDMGRLAQQAPALSVEELYLLSKRRRAEKEGRLAVPKVAGSEKPNFSSARPSVWNPSEDVPQGQAGFKQLLRESLAKADLSHVGPDED